MSGLILPRRLRQQQGGFIINPFRFGSSAPTGTVVAMMNASATDGATSFVDVRGHTYTRASTAEVETGISGFGGSCMFLPGGTGTFTAPDSADFDLLTSGVDFSVEVLVRFLTAPPSGNGASLVSRGSDGSNNFIFRATDTQLQWVFPGIDALGKNFTFATGTTYHCYYGRSGSGAGTANYLAVNGGVSNFTGVGRTTNSAGVLRLGRSSFGAPLHGYLAHRITVGVCKWTANFTPPSGPFTS